MEFLFYWFSNKFALLCNTPSQKSISQLIMRSTHSTNQLKIETDHQKLYKKLSPRNNDIKKTQTSSPSVKSSLTSSTKKTQKETKKIPQTIINRVAPSKSQKILFQSSNKLSYKLTKAAQKPFEKDIIFHRSHQTPIISERNSKTDLFKFSKKTNQKGYQGLKKQMLNVIKVKVPEKMQATNTTAVKSTSQSIQQSVTRDHFNFLDVIGRGGYGKVWKVSHRKSKKFYAMKQMSKAVIVMKKSVKSILTERKILSKLKHRFISNMITAFHDRENLYLLMDLLQGGDLRSHITQRRKFTEEQTRFFVACIVVGLEYLASKKIIHRDLKPQNLVLDSHGYIRITDFGIACISDQPGQKDTSGTPGYMAPEVMCCQDHSFGVDYFALGVISYELMMCKRPYRGKNRAQIRQSILAKQVQISKSQVPPNWSVQSIDFINKLIQRHPKNRLGSKGGIVQIKQHPWLRKYPWKKLMNHELKSPFIPEPVHLQSEQQELDPTALMQYKLLQRLQNYNNLFDGYEHKWSDSSF